MNEVYIWVVKYQISEGFGSTERKIKVVTKTDTYTDAENLAIKAIEKVLKGSGIKFVRLLDIKPSKMAYSEIYD